MSGKGTGLSETSGAAEGPFWRFPSLQKERQTARRGWTRTDITIALTSPAETKVSVDLALKHPATIYYRSDGHSIVRNDVTGDVFHVSDTADRNWRDPFGDPLRSR